MISFLRLERLFPFFFPLIFLQHLSVRKKKGRKKRKRKKNVSTYVLGIFGFLLSQLLTSSTPNTDKIRRKLRSGFIQLVSNCLTRSIFFSLVVFNPRPLPPHFRSFSSFSSFSFSSFSSFSSSSSSSGRKTI